MELAPETTCHGFSVLSREALPEINGEAFMMLHGASGAKLLYLKNDDNNKSFSIGFRTPPQDDTGVFHILEHSVLCGSRKFPVKEPFVDLLKSSMQTFLNAMTFADKTLYPVASTNEQDLFNLMDVYLDAVFHPQIYTKRAIFEQEGWHCELSETSDGQESLAYNGVVYNEMKGVFSDASSVLYDEVQHYLLEGTPYEFESGGIPTSIPTLTYEGYLDEHSRHYRTDNSYIILYGNMDIDRALAFLDEQYLAPVAAEQQAADAARIAQGLEPLCPRTLKYADPAVRTGIVRTMDTAPENACAAAGYIIGTSHDRMRVIGTAILLDALFGSNQTPFKRALLDAGYANDITASVADGILQPFALVQFHQPHRDAADRLPEILAEHTRMLLERGLDEELIEASLSHAEFTMREHEMGAADGVIYAMNALSGWLYDDEAALDYIRYEDVLAALRDALGTTYYSDLLRELFCESRHYAAVSLVPTPGEPDEANVQAAADLAAKQAQLSDEEREQIHAHVAELRALQEAEDTPEARATLPRLSAADIDEAPIWPEYALAEDAPLPCLRHTMPTHGIVYAYRYFDANAVPFEDVPYLSILMSVLGKLDTAKHTAAQLDTLAHGKLGNLDFYYDVYESLDIAEPPSLMLVVSASALSENIEWLAALPREILCETDFSQTGKIAEILQQRRIGMEQMFLNAGHSCAAARVSSYYARAGVLGEHLANVDFYRFLCDLLDDFDNRCAMLATKLSDLAAQLFCDNNCTVSFAGSDDDYESFWNANPACGRISASDTHLEIPAPVRRNEGFMLPSDVTYSALGWDRREFGVPYSGTWAVAARALTYDFLWNEVRVQGGAYGVGFKTARMGNTRFYSFRDPHVDETLERFAKAATWLAEFDVPSEVLDGFIIATVAALDTPLKPRKMLRAQATQYFAHIAPEDRIQARNEMIGTTVDGIRAFAPAVKAMVDKQAICVFGSRDILKEAKTPLELIDLL